MARAGTVRRVNVAVAFDHRGVHLRDTILDTLREDGHEIVDLGTDTDAVRIDYPDKAIEIGAALKDGLADLGVLVCGSGVGAAVAACKIVGFEVTPTTASSTISRFSSPLWTRSRER